MDSDRALELLGDRSRWKIGLYVLASTFMGFGASWHMLSIVFIGMEPSQVHCRLPDGYLLNESVPMETKNGETALSKCKVWFNYSAATNRTIPCPNGWQYAEEREHSIIHEWDLVCDTSYLVETSQTILVVGVMVGALIMSISADKFGRKFIFIASVIASSVVGILSSTVQNYVGFAVMRFLTGVLQQGMVLAGFVYVIELFPASQRTMIGMLSQCFWAVGMGILALFAYMSPNWRHILLCISLPGLLSLVMLWVIPESVPWLWAKQRIAESKEVLLSAARVSRVKLPQEYHLTEEEKAELSEIAAGGLSGKVKACIAECRGRKQVKGKDMSAQYTIMDVLRSRRLLSFAVINAYLWCANSLIYYGLSLSTGSLAGNPYLNFFLSGCVEIPAYVIAAFALKYIGRRWSIFAFHIIAGIPLFVTLFIPTKTESGTDLSQLILGLSMVGKFGITGSFGSIFLYAPELFPTTVRNIGLGIASIGGRLGNIIAPFSSYVAKRVWWLPNVVFGVMAILAALLTLVLPETLNRPLPETIADVESWSRTISKEEKLRYKAEQKAMREMKDMIHRQNGDENLNEPLREKSAIVA